MKKIKRIAAIIILMICLLFFGYISHTCKAVKEGDMYEESV